MCWSPVQIEVALECFYQLFSKLHYCCAGKGDSSEHCWSCSKQFEFRGYFSYIRNLKFNLLVIFSILFNIRRCNTYVQVIYGDTDSIMIHSGLDDITKAKAIAGKVIQEVRPLSGIFGEISSCCKAHFYARRFLVSADFVFFFLFK